MCIHVCNHAPQGRGVSPPVPALAHCRHDSLASDSHSAYSFIAPALVEFDRPPFSATHFLGTASGQFLRPAASRLLLSRFLPNGTGPSHKAPARLGSSGLSLLAAPGKWGKKKEKNSCLTSTQ